MRLAFALICAASVASAQSPEVSAADGAVLRAVDRVSGELVDISMETGRTAEHGRLAITLHECRYPIVNPASDSFARVTIVDVSKDTEVFSGWLVASSPALSALDHPRYDVWVLRCNTA